MTVFLFCNIKLLNSANTSECTYCVVVLTNVWMKFKNNAVVHFIKLQSQLFHHKASVKAIFSLSLSRVDVMISSVAFMLKGLENVYVQCIDWSWWLFLIFNWLPDWWHSFFIHSAVCILGFHSIVLHYLRTNVIFARFMLAMFAFTFTSHSHFPLVYLPFFNIRFSAHRSHRQLVDWMNRKRPVHHCAVRERAHATQLTTTTRTRTTTTTMKRRKLTSFGLICSGSANFGHLVVVVPFQFILFFLFSALYGFNGVPVDFYSYTY